MTRILPAHPNDIPDLIRIIADVFDEYGWIFRAEDELPDFLDYDAWYVGTPHRLFTLWKDERRIGCIAVKVGSEGAYLSRVYVSRTERGQGFGRMIVEFAVDEARKQGHSHIHLWTDTRFETAHKLYEATGFHRQDVIRALHDTNISFEFRYDREIKMG